VAFARGASLDDALMAGCDAASAALSGQIG
jgi:hypothetical protein